MNRKKRSVTRSMFRVETGLLAIVVVSLTLPSCVNSTSITSAPHRTAPAKAESGKVLSSYPVRYTTSSGFGSIAGSVGGAVLGSKVGSGNASRIAGSFLGSFLGGATGNAAERAAREKSAREITVSSGGKTFRMISKVQPPLRVGERVLVLKNVYGEVLSVSKYN